MLDEDFNTRAEILKSKSSVISKDPLKSFVLIQIKFLPGQHRKRNGNKWVEEEKRETIKHTIQSNFHGNVKFINVLK